MISRVDRKLLSALQKDARLTNNELADIIGLSASQCSRRRLALEQAGYIAGYHAHLNRSKSGFGLTSIISVSLTSHSARHTERAARLFNSLPEVLEAHAMTGDSDYFLKVVTADLDALSEFISQQILADDSIQTVKTAVALNTIKDTHLLPID